MVACYTPSRAKCFPTYLLFCPHAVPVSLLCVPRIARNEEWRSRQDAAWKVGDFVWAYKIVGSSCFSLSGQYLCTNAWSYCAAWLGKQNFCRMDFFVLWEPCRTLTFFFESLWLVFVFAVLTVTACLRALLSVSVPAVLLTCLQFFSFLLEALMFRGDDCLCSPLRWHEGDWAPAR
ncbi:hypothetical protein TcCL_Unassigned01336 [Trypanosoma cruzi]|nr:hypothetical protein TcCL_Unassigned01336 [Trypanosoma cruzi]